MPSSPSKISFRSKEKMFRSVCRCKWRSWVNAGGWTTTTFTAVWNVIRRSASRSESITADRVGTFSVIRVRRRTPLLLRHRKNHNVFVINAIKTWRHEKIKKTNRLLSSLVFLLSHFTKRLSSLCIDHGVRRGKTLISNARSTSSRLFSGISAMKWRKIPKDGEADTGRWSRTTSPFIAVRPFSSIAICAKICRTIAGWESVLKHPESSFT